MNYPNGDKLRNKLRNACRDLDTATDALNAALAGVEARLDALHIGVRGECECASGTLAYGKEEGSWGLYWRACAGGAFKPLQNAPRRVRLLAVPALELLFQRMTEEAEKQKLDILDATARLQKLGAP